MAVREVITVGDARLRERARPVQTITPEIRQLASDMVETMHAYDGIGLAATQVAEMHRLLVIEVPEDEEIWGSGELYVIANPEIIKESRETDIGTEGCLSVPGYVGEDALKVLVRGLVPWPGSSNCAPGDSGPRFPARDRPPERRAVSIVSPLPTASGRSSRAPRNRRSG